MNNVELKSTGSPSPLGVRGMEINYAKDIYYSAVSGSQS
jgi:hypothetical protein